MPETVIDHADELLRVEQLSAGWGDSTVIEDIAFTLRPGSGMALLGRNGVGKSSLLATLMGLTRRHRGSIRMLGRELCHLPAHARAHAGLGWVPQERDIFASLSVEENLLVVARPGPWNLQRVWRSFPRLHERRRNLGNQLSGGEQQMLALARALMLNPRLLLLDEPLEGLAPLIAQELLASIADMRREASIAVILVEQHARQILPLTDHALVLERGRVAHHGPSAALEADQQLLERLLGVGGN